MSSSLDQAVRDLAEQAERSALLRELPSLTPVQAAEVAQCSADVIRRLLRDGSLPRVPGIRRHLVPTWALVRWLDGASLPIPPSA